MCGWNWLYEEKCEVGVQVEDIYKSERNTWVNVNKCNNKLHCQVRTVDRAAKKRILLSTTTKGLVQWYLSTHLDSSSRLDPNRSYWRAPLSPCQSRMASVVWRERDEEGDGHLSYRVASHWAGPRQGVSLRCAQSWWGSVRRIALQSCVAATTRARDHAALHKDHLT